jgi:hypothetical protein
MKAFHFLRDNRTAGYGTEPAWSVGEERKIKGDTIKLCERGYHSSRTPFDAFAYASGPMLCLVEVPKSGTIRVGDKQVSNRRKLLAAVNIEKELRLFTVACAERLLPRLERAFPDTDKFRKVVQGAEDYINDRITNQELQRLRDGAALTSEEVEIMARDRHRIAMRAAINCTLYPSTVHVAQATGFFAVSNARWSMSLFRSLPKKERDWQRRKFNELCVKRLVGK